MSMRRLPSPDRTAQGLAVLRLEGPDHPDIGTVVTDESLSRIGRVVDVFGPVDTPYLSISPDDGRSATDLVGTKLYVR